MAGKKKNNQSGAVEVVKDPAEVARINAEREAKALVLFTVPEIDQKKLVRRNLPQMIKPGDVPEGQAISGVIVDVVNSPVTTVKGKLLWIRHSSGAEFLFPVTGTIRAALAPGLKGEDEGLVKQLKTEIGNTIVARRLADKPNKAYNRDMFMFDVFTTKA